MINCTVDTCNPDHICGFCKLHNVMADYLPSAKDIVEQMPMDKLVTVEGIMDLERVSLE